MAAVQISEKQKEIFRDYLRSKPGKTWSLATLHIFSSASETTITDRYQYPDGRTEELAIPMEIAIEKEGAVYDAVDQIKERAGSRWNILQYQIDASGKDSIEVHWQERPEEYTYPEENPDGIYDAMLHDHEADIPVSVDLSSIDDISPYYYIRDEHLTIREMVTKIIEQGSELTSEELQLINFNNPGWQEWEKSVQDMIARDPGFKMKLEGIWNEANEVLNHVRFGYVYNGEEKTHSIKI